MKLFLASSFDKSVGEFAKLCPSSKRCVLFIPNAADPYKEEHFWVNWDRDAFKKFGYELTEVDLKEMSKTAFENLLSKADILHVCGGSVSYLGWILRDKGLEEVIVGAVKNEQVIYTGTSAGSMIMSKDLAMFSYDEEEKLEYVSRGFNKKGFGLVPWTIAPHSNQADFVESHKSIVQELLNNPTAVFLLHDNQAIWVEDDTFKFVQA